MTLAQFHAAVRAIAGKRYCTSVVEVVTPDNSSGDKTSVTWKAYISGPGWSEAHADPDAALADLRAPGGDDALNAVGEVPVSS